MVSAEYEKPADHNPGNNFSFHILTGNPAFQAETEA
jgi:hypothetical protein